MKKEKSIIEELKKIVSCIPDPRSNRNKLHSLFDIIVISLCGVISGCDGWQSIENNAIDKEEWFKRFLELENGIPSHDTISRVFSLLEPEVFNDMLQEIGGILREKFKGEQEIIAIDGKTLRGSHDKSLDKQAIHIVSAYQVNGGITLCQLKTAVKSNEITAVPELLDMIDISGAVITCDAMNCQKKTAEKIIKKDAEYVLQVKGNQNNLH